MKLAVAVKRSGHVCSVHRTGIGGVDPLDLIATIQVRRVRQQLGASCVCRSSSYLNAFTFAYVYLTTSDVSYLPTFLPICLPTPLSPLFSCSPFG